MELNEQKYQELLSFIKSEILGEGDENVILDRDTSLEDDLGVTGIDADKFILKFSRKFNVDLSNFNIDSYFEPEFSFWLFGRKKRKRFTIKELENAILTGVLK
ncbi:DUF1493 family protein [Chitinophaga tropicalis]|uniref:DUF1493 family protein n=1 Tax=Chitinophaga tropicalis TaxID=2683588 RepID=A0A7K1U514_9BACT|nr:DUF1493 family protein [Chitinophaga tropicalis]MVT09448.1 DUF1493 family protein [Chitinophaga tropicalis]